MSKGGGQHPPKRPGKPILSAEDRSLWQHVAATVDKRAQGKPRVPEIEPPAEPLKEDVRPKPARNTAPQAVSTPANRCASLKTKSGRVVPAAAKLRSATAVPGVDRRKARRIATGVIEIEARLDLHGMTQSAAHARLIGFLQKAAVQGMRTVLVITGKGGARKPPSLDAAWWETEEIGILRRSVPRWLAEPPLRAIVIGCQPASPRHGGDGALYILLRRARAGRQT